MRALIFLLTCFFLKFCSAIDSITTTKNLKDPETLVSSDNTFTMGFFSPPNSTNRYVGIWYSKPSVKLYIWVANKDHPLTDSSGVFKISKDGNLRVQDGKNTILWSTNITAGANASVARLQDTGNFALTSKDGGLLWQSFDHPIDCFLPHMDLPLTKGNQKKALQSWTNSTNPSDGPFTAGIDITGLPQIVVWKGDQRHWRSGPWNGNTFIGVQISYNDVIQNQLQVSYANGGPVVKYYSLRPVLTTYQLTTDGRMAQIWWDEGKKEWGVQWQDPSTVCDPYSMCGPFGTCNSNRATICQCLKGFEPMNKAEWSKNNWTDGCVRRKRLQCESSNGGKADGFLRLGMMKIPDHEIQTTGTQDECRSQCLNDCSCLGYAHDTYSGCMTWSSTLVDLQEFSIGGLDFYLRLAHSELGTNNSKWKVITAVIGGSLGTTVIAVLLCILWRRRAHQQALGKVENKKITEEYYKTVEKKNQEKLEELPLFSFESLAAATNNFHEDNKLGRGGFGSVYRGTLKGGQEIAVKRLARASTQGIEEFMNEVTVISKLQHRNLVRLLGCSVEEDEKMLVYEYMPKKSLDAYLFVPEMRKKLDWNKRFNIIEGICRGLDYLHKGSRLKIIHRDLKASNILLDEELNPKISDFGMARIFGGDQDEADTRRIVGTYGYMSPEYAMQGLFSEKSDVFSFGVLLLEIISGKKKGIFSDEEQSLSLLGYAWSLWNTKDMIQLIDPVISEPQHEREVSRCMHLGLLCVQEFAKDRPTMSTVISMLNGEISDLPPPTKPGFANIFEESNLSQQTKQNPSANFVSITAIDGR